MRITNSGDYRFCRWSNDTGTPNISSISPVTFFQRDMAALRIDVLEGRSVSTCSDCYEMEQHGKISGRQRQLLKIGVDLNSFEKSLRSSTFFEEFLESATDQGKTKLLPVDWQIDLGNHCNSACVFCCPEFSSRLAAEFKNIGLIDRLPPASWVEDSDLLSRFIETLRLTPKLAYLHFIGGETLITPAFKTILEKLIDHGLSDCAIGFTTNLTVWNSEIVNLLKRFQTVNVGLSIETMDSVNDYVRWPSRSDQIQEVLKKWVTLSKNYGWYTSLRVTPTLLTVGRLVKVYDFAFENHLAVESCNFLQRPRFLKSSVLPMSYRQSIIDALKTWTELQDFPGHVDIINVRDPNVSQQQVVQDAQSYIEYLRTSPDESDLLPQAAKYLKTLDRSRSISVLDYLPEYEELFRTAGY
jgi:sulfatase maturation enzyme AslB (radical SAM superfamily)